MREPEFSRPPCIGEPVAGTQGSPQVERLPSPGVDARGHSKRMINGLGVVAWGVGGEVKPYCSTVKIAVLRMHVSN